MNDKFLYFDTETTDTQAKDLLQLAFLTDDPDIKLNLYFKPKQEISFGAMAVHHITPEMVEDKKYFENTPLPEENLDPEFKGDDLIEYLEFLAQKYIWVAHNVEFDLEVLNKKGIEIPKSICTLKVARNALTEGNRDLESYRLQYLRYYLGLYKNENTDHITAHDALSDVYFLRDLFHYLQDNTKLSTEQMIIITKQPQIIRELRFGKYAGKTLEEIARMDREYLIWIAENMEDKEDLVWNAKRVLDMDVTSNPDGNLTWT
jgi:DNA polymerase III epsilon subunit-like protein